MSTWEQSKWPERLGSFIGCAIFAAFILLLIYWPDVSAWWAGL